VLAEFYGLTQDPFRLSPDPKFCYRHANFAKAKAYMQYVLHQGEGFVMVTGQPGTGKTLLIEDLLSDPRTAKVAKAHVRSTQVGAEDLLRLVASAFGVEARNSSKSTILLNLRAVLLRQMQSGHNSLVIVDEAQNLRYESIEELRMITNLQEVTRPLLQVFLVGQDSLRALVSQPRMEQLRQRILAACRMEPLGMGETQGYVEHRLTCAGWKGRPSFSGEAVWLLHAATGGVPRLINSFAGRLLLHGAVEERSSLDADDARLVIRELQDELPLGSGLPTEIPSLVSMGPERAVEVGELGVEMSTPAAAPEGVSNLGPEQPEVPEESNVGAASEPGEAEREEAPLVREPEPAGEGDPVRAQPVQAEPAAGEPLVPAEPGSFAIPESGPAIPVSSDVRKDVPPSPQPASTALPVPNLLVDSDQGRPGGPPSGPGPGRAEEGPVRAVAAAEPLPSEMTRKAGRRTWFWLAAAGVSALTILGAGAALLALRPNPVQSFLARLEPVAEMAKALGQGTHRSGSDLAKGSEGQAPSVSSTSVILRSVSGNSSGTGKAETVARVPPAGGTPKESPAGAGDARSAPEARTLPANTSRLTLVAGHPPGHQDHLQAHELAPSPGAAEGGQGVSAGGAVSGLRTQGNPETPKQAQKSGTTAATATAAPVKNGAATATEGAGTEGTNTAALPRKTAAAVPPKAAPPVLPSADLVAAAKPPSANRSETVPERSGLGTLAGKLRSLGLAPERDGEDALKVNLVRGLRFDSGSADLPADSRPFVKEVAEALAGNADLAVKVVGHTDPSGPKEYNDWLSLQRAKAVAAVLVAGGVPADEIATDGLGSSEPLSGTAQRGTSRPSVDRRVELIIHARAAR
jgi:type II secretory pathway predicted ATPase ExeA/outer membrane protein OmpA-like peptidoglycan-associated protein